MAGPWDRGPPDPGTLSGGHQTGAMRRAAPGRPAYGSRSATRMREDGPASGVIVASPPSVAIAT